MPGGFFKTAAIKNEDIEPISDLPQPPQKPPPVDHLPNPTHSWLSAISARRGSMGFHGGMSPMDDDASNDGSFGGRGALGGLGSPEDHYLDERRQSYRGQYLAIPKSAFSNFNDDSTGASYMETPNQAGPLITVSEAGHIVVPDLDVLKETHLAEKVATAIPLEDFPIATKESLAELKEMKERLKLAEDDMFEMDVEQTNVKLGQAPNAVTLGDTHEKPPSKLVNYIVEKGFAQSWFFKNSDNPDEGAKSHEHQTRTAMPMHDDDNAGFMNISRQNSKEQKNVQQTDFVGLFEKRKEEQRKKESREEAYFHAPQNY